MFWSIIPYNLTYFLPSPRVLPAPIDFSHLQVFSVQSSFIRATCVILSFSLVSSAGSTQLGTMPFPLLRCVT